MPVRAPGRDDAPLIPASPSHQRPSVETPHHQEAEGHARWPALDPDPPWTTTTGRKDDGGRVTRSTVLDHRPLFSKHRDAPPDLQNPAMPSPTPLLAHTTMTTVRLRELPQHPVEPI